MKTKRKPSVTKLWEAYRCVVGMSAPALSMSDSELLDGGGHPVDIIEDSAQGMFPAILSVPAKTASEAMMQLCALTAIVTHKIYYAGPYKREDILPWRTGLISILCALHEAGDLPKCDIGRAIGGPSVSAMRQRLAEMEGAP